MDPSENAPANEDLYLSWVTSSTPRPNNNTVIPEIYTFTFKDNGGDEVTFCSEIPINKLQYGNNIQISNLGPFSRPNICEIHSGNNRLILGYKYTNNYYHDERVRYELIFNSKQELILIKNDDGEMRPIISYK